MSVSVTINGTTFNYPSDGEDPGWGGDATDAFVAVVEALNTLLAPGDILTTSFSIANNISSLTNINGLLFDPGTVRAANIDYNIYRISTSNPSGHAETGVILLSYDDSAAAGAKWRLTQNIDGISGVSLSVTDSGQIQYMSNDIGSTGYSGLITFKARVLPK